MRLAVAGLPQSSLAERSRRLAEGDWSAFSPAERAAFHFAGKQSREPGAIAPGDLDRLVRHFGPARALDLVWWSSHCHYRTCVADAFGLPLERENVFDGFRTLSGTAKP